MGFFEDLKHGHTDPVHRITDEEHFRMVGMGLDPDCHDDVDVFLGCGCCMKKGCRHCSPERSKEETR